MRFSICFLLFILMNSSSAGEVTIAVAANFAGPMQQIAEGFEQTSGHKVQLSFGATGKFYAQIKNAAPFDILLAADEATPSRLAKEGIAIKSSQFTYATGKLVLWSPDVNRVDAKGDVLKHGKFNHLAIASPGQAPYGAAAKETLISLKLYNVVSPKLVQGESVGQTYSYIATGNAELGFVALSQVWENNRIKSGSGWIVPDNLYSPLLQDAILLKHGQRNPAALAMMVYLKSDGAKKIIRLHGYQIK